MSKPWLTNWIVSLHVKAMRQRLIDNGHVEDVDAFEDAVRGDADAKRWEGAELGTAVHAAIEDVIRDGALPPEHDVSYPYVKQWLAWREEFQPRLSQIEVTLWSRRFGYAGTIDALAHFGDHAVLLDWKSGKRVYADYSLQLAAYARCDEMILPLVDDPDPLTPEHWAAEPLPEITGAYVVHLQPDDYSMVPVDISDTVFGYFTALLDLMPWDKRDSKRVVGRRIRPDEVAS